MEIDAYIDEIKKVFADTAAEYHAKIEVQVQVLYHSFSLSEELPVVQTAKRALAGLGISPVCCAGGGGMDGNHFNAHGIATVGLTLGYTKNHTPEEQIVVQDLIKAGDLVKALITETYKNGRTSAE